MRYHRAMRASVFTSVVGLVVAFGCSATSSDESGDGGQGGAGNGSGTGGVDLGNGAGGGGVGNHDCAVGAELVYVLGTDNTLYSFEPANKLFKAIGPLQCSTSMQPNSMAVDRNAVAWVNYVESDGLGVDTAGAVFKVSTSDASCQPTNIALGPGWYRLGMGFSSDAEGSSSETLFVTGTGDPGSPTSPGLGKIDLASQTLQPIGSFSGALLGQNAELTGTGDARLFGFFTTTPVQVAQIDKTTGATPTPAPLAQVETPAAWAFSFWGGDFYLYTAPDPSLDPTRTTNVTHYRPTTGEVDAAYMTNIGFIIVGAGVSTCAPIAPPK